MNKRRFAAFAATVLIFVGLLFGQGPIQKVRLWDTNLSHSLLLNWNEDRAAGYTLNWIGITADRTITLQGNPTLDDWFDQSVKSTFSPTFVTVKLSALTDGYVPYHVSDAVGLADSVIRTDGTLVGVGMLPTVAQLEVNTSQIITSTTAAPYLKIVNLSDTARDPIIQFAVGATPVVKFTMGVDDSDNDTWKLSVGDILGDDHDVIIISSEGGVPGVDEFTLINTFTGVSGVRGVCTDGTYIYCSRSTDKKLYKFDITDGTQLDTSAAVDTTDIGRVATDGTHVYVICWGAHVVKQYLCADLSYVASSDVWTGLSYADGIYYRAGYLYVTNNSTCDVRKIRCSDMGTTWTTNFTLGAGINQTARALDVATDGQFIYVQDSFYGNNRIIRLNMDGTWYDATDVVKPMSLVYHTLWCAGDYLYDTAEYVANDYYVEKRNKSDLSISETFNVLNRVTQGCRWGDYHYLVSVESTGIYKYQYATSSASAPAKTRFRLKDVYGQYVDIATLTADVRLGVGTTIPSETIEAVGNIKATAGQFISTKATGTAPAVVSSTTVCTNLNAGLVDGYHHDQSLLIAASPTFVALNLSATSNQIVLQSTGVTGTITATPASSNKVWTLQNFTGTIYQTGGTDVAVADGGTNKSAWTLYAIPYASGTTTIGEIAIGTAGQVLAVNGGANGYTWASALSNPMTDIGDMIIGGAAGAPAKLADIAVGSYMRSGGVMTAPLWSTLTLPNTGTAYRLPVFSATNVMTELAAVGATGEYLKGNTGAIPSFATLNQAAVAGLTTADGPTFDHLHLGANQIQTISRARAYLSSIQLNINHNTHTKVLLNAETYDSGNNFDSVTNYRFVAPVSGYYVVVGAVYFTGCPTTDVICVIAEIYVDGARYTAGTNVAVNNVIGEMAATATDIIYLAASSYVELYAYNWNSGALNTVDVFGDTDFTYLSIHLLSIA